MLMTVASDVNEVVRKALSSREDLAAVYLFGSAATGSAHAFSDVDVAVLFAGDLSAQEMFARGLEIGTTLEATLDRPVDVVILNRAAPALCFQVLKTGNLILEPDPHARGLYVMRALGRYYDMIPYFDYHNARLLARIREEGLGRGYQGDRDALAEARRLSEKLASDAKRDP